MSDDLLSLIPIVAIVMIFGTGMLKLVLNYLKRKAMFAMYHQERMAAIEKGIELPPLPEDFFHEDGMKNMFDMLADQGRCAEQRQKSADAASSSHGTLLTGLILVLTSLTVYLALHFTVGRTENGGDVALFALIPAGTGAAFLVYYLTAGRKANADREEERKAQLAEAARVKNPPA